jgi:hypothetical protein
MKLIKLIKTLIHLANNYETMIESEHNYAQTRINTVNRKVDEVNKLIKDRTTLNVDWSSHGDSSVIVIGNLNGKDYIQIYRFTKKNLADLIGILKHMSYTAHLGVVDAPPTIKAVIEQELEP